MRGHTNSDGDVVLIPSNVCVEEAGSFHFRSHLTPGQDDSYTELSLVPCTIAASAPSREFIRRNKAGHEGVCRMTCGTHIPQLEGRRPPEKSWLGGGGVGSVYSVADGFEFAFYFEEHIDYNRVELGARPGSDDLDRFFVRERIFVASFGAERIVYIRNSHDPGRKRYFFALQTLRISGTVPTLVMGESDIDTGA